jgi:deoxyribodipyrimidine photolyase-related protein
MLRFRNLIVIFGDQLDHQSAVFAGFDPARDLIWMAEVKGEATHVRSHKVRIALFLTAMRHFAAELRAKGYHVEYRKLDAKDNRGELAAELAAAVKKFLPERIVAVEPGEFRIEKMLKELAVEMRIMLEIRADRHFLCKRDEFTAWAKGRKQLRMEFFYREMRKRHNVLMEGEKPVGGKWNFDVENRGSFGKAGPPAGITPPHLFERDETTKAVLHLVETHFANHPGSLEHFAFPVTAAQAEVALQDFVKHRLPEFGAFQDAMWTGETFLYHARISAAMNLKLLNPRRVVTAVEKAYFAGKASLAAVEGFIRQVLGWREYVRGVYWMNMPRYLELNALDAKESLPDFYWDGKTEMNCLRETLGQTLEYGYAHHIQRLMVTGLFALLFGVDPVEVHKWYLAVYYDAVEWVELPNTAGMSQFSDGGIMASKPYVASGKYIARMSNYCTGCKYNPGESTGEKACPFTTLYWDFLLRHEEMLGKNQRMLMQLKNLGRLSAAKKEAILAQAKEIRVKTAKGGY